MQPNTSTVMFNREQKLVKKALKTCRFVIIWHITSFVGRPHTCR